MPIVAITANSTLNYGGSVDTTHTSQAFEDIFISDDNAAYAYYGDSPVILDLMAGAGTTAHALFRTASIAANIPAGSTINTATVRVYVTHVSGTHVTNIHGILQPWVEDEVTYNSYSTGNSWATAGAGSLGTDITSTAEDSETYSSTGYIEVTATDIIQDVLDGNSEGWMFRNDSGGFSQLRRTTGTDGQRVEVIINYATIAITGVTGTIQSGGQIVISTNNLGTATSVTLGGEALTIDGTDTDEVAATIPTDIDLKWGESTYTLAVGDGTDTATLVNQTLSARSGWSYVNFNGVAPDADTTESFYEMAVNDLSFTPAVDDQLQYSTATGMTVDSQTIVDVDPPATVSGTFAWFDDSAGTRTAESGYAIPGGQNSTAIARSVAHSIARSLTSLI